MPSNPLVFEVLDKLHYFVKLYSIDSLFVCGELPLHLYLGNQSNLERIEISCAYPEAVKNLGNLFSTEIIGNVATFDSEKNTVQVDYESPSGKILVEFQGRSTQTYMNNQEIKDWMKRVNIEDVPLMHNLYGREFTINALVYSLVAKELRDPTNRAEKDFEAEKIVSLLPPEILIKYHPVAILHAIQLSLTLDFRIDGRLKSAMRDQSELLKKTLSTERLLQEFVKILQVKSNDKVDVLKEFGLESLLLHPALREYLNTEN